MTDTYTDLREKAEAALKAAVCQGGYVRTSRLDGVTLGPMSIEVADGIRDFISIAQDVLDALEAAEQKIAAVVAWEKKWGYSVHDTGSWGGKAAAELDDILEPPALTTPTPKEN